MVKMPAINSTDNVKRKKFQNNSEDCKHGKYWPKITKTICLLHGRIQKYFGDKFIGKKTDK